MSILRKCEDDGIREAIERSRSQTKPTKRLFSYSTKTFTTLLSSFSSGPLVLVRIFSAPEASNLKRSGDFVSIVAFSQISLNSGEDLMTFLVRR